VIEALSKEVQNIGGDPAGIPLPSSHAAAAAESGSSEAPQQQQRQQHWEQVLFEPAVLHLLLASKASIVRHLWHLSNNTGAGSNQAAAAAVQPYHEDLLSAMGVPPAGRQQRGVWDTSLTERDTQRAVGNTLMVTRFLWRRSLLVLQQQGQKFGSGSSNAHGTSILTNQEQQQQQQQQQIPDVLLPLLPQWALLQVELLLLADLPAFKFVLLDSLNFMLQLLKCLQLSKQQYAWAPTVQALSQPVLLQLLPHMEQFAKEQHAAIAARAASSSSSSSGGGSSSAAEVVQLDASMVDDTYGCCRPCC
jgi:hypothetical protein